MGNLKTDPAVSAVMEASSTLSMVAARPTGTPPKGSPHQNMERLSASRQAEIDRQRAIHRQWMNDVGSLDRILDEVAGSELSSVIGKFFLSNDLARVRAGLIGRAESDEIAETSLRIRQHQLDILGSGRRNFGNPYRWHEDILSGRKWDPHRDLLAMGEAAFDLVVDRDSGSDIKSPWDLSNMHWIPTLILDVFVNKNEASLRSFVEDTRDWLEKNPPFLGVNWFCPMNISMRAINLTLGLVSFYPRLEPEFVQTLTQSLFQHGVATMAGLEVNAHGHRNNHYLTNLVGMFYLGNLFSEQESGQQWRAFAQKELEKEILYQTYEDGVSFEDSTSYHRLSTEMLLYAAILGDSSKKPFSETYKSRLHRALKFTADLMAGTGRVPQFGDNDNGRLVQFFGYETTEVLDHRHLLALGGAYFGDAELCAAGAGAEREPLFVLGRGWDGKRPASKREPRLKSYPASGFHILQSPRFHLVLRDGQIGPACNGGHAHEDQLSFTLSIDGREMFVDPGSYRYSSDFEARNAFRSVAYHNTMQYGDLPMHEFDRESFAGLWWMKDRSKTVREEIKLEQNQFFYRGSMTTYKKHWNSEVHLLRRQIKFDTLAGRLTMTDTVSLSGPVDQAVPVTSRLMLAPGLDATDLGSGRLRLSRNGKELATALYSGEGVDLRIEDGSYSPQYGIRRPCSQLRFCWPSRSPEPFVFQLHISDA